MSDSDSSGECTGSIIDASHVLTAGHCTYDESGEPFAPSAYTVAAGLVYTGDFTTEQSDTVSAVRVMPAYASGSAGDADDVAELTLSQPLRVDPEVAPIAVVGVGQEAPVGTSVVFSGWGQSTPNATDDHEHYLTDTLLSPWRCISGRPSTLCAVSSTGDSCPGDSGSGLVLPGAAPDLIGVLDFGYIGSAGECQAGDASGFTDLASPEIVQWLAGSDTPALAPRSSDPAQISDPDPRVGSTATCQAPAGTGATSVSFWFVDSASDDVLQRGPDTFTVPQSMLGHTIKCVAAATNTGGTTYIASGAGATILAQSRPRISVTVTRSGRVSVSDAAAGGLTLRLTVQRTRPRRTVFTRSFRTRAQATASLAGLLPGTYIVCVTTASQGAYAAGRRCVPWTHNGSSLTYLQTRAIGAHGGSAVQLTARAPIRGDRATLRWWGHARGHRVSHRSQVHLRARTLVRAPTDPAGVRWNGVVISVHGTMWHGAAIAGGRERVLFAERENGRS
jgi:V8-like Glu-specific endopeptidase